jgi:hypothetical protein
MAQPVQPPTIPPTTEAPQTLPYAVATGVAQTPQPIPAAIPQAPAPRINDDANHASTCASFARCRNGQPTLPTAEVTERCEELGPQANQEMCTLHSKVKVLLQQLNKYATKEAHRACLIRNLINISVALLLTVLLEVFYEKIALQTLICVFIWGLTIYTTAVNTLMYKLPTTEEPLCAEVQRLSRKIERGQCEQPLNEQKIRGYEREYTALQHKFIHYTIG